MTTSVLFLIAALLTANPGNEERTNAAPTSDYKGKKPTPAASPAEPSPRQATSTKGTLAALDEKNGFRDLTFGTALSELKGMSRVGEYEGFDLYIRSDDKLAVGETKLTSIAYGFWKGRLAVVMIQFTGEHDATKLLKALAAAYGQPEVKNAIGPHVMWIGEKVRMAFSFDQLEGSGLVMMLSQSTFREMQAAQQAAAKEATTDL